MTTRPGRRTAIPIDDYRRVQRASGLLAEANEADILGPTDVHVAARLSALAGETDPEVALGLALATRAVRTGSVALDLHQVAEIDTTFPWPTDTDDWLARISRSPLVAQRILVIDNGLLYLERYHDQEVLVADELSRRRHRPRPTIAPDRLDAGLGRLFPAEADADQREAARLAVAESTIIITGGPGTGKTTTIAKVLALLAEQYAAADPNHVPRFALAAPTAKAAARLAEAFDEASRRLPEADRDRLPATGASTLHRLLGWKPESRSRFRHDRHSRLPHDVVVVDEASMVSLTMMARLLEALRPEARLIIVGDPDQLSSVEAGAVLADLVAGLGADARRPLVARLRRTYRFGGQIGLLAQALRDGAAEEALGILQAGGPEVSLFADLAERRGLMVDAALELRGHAREGDAAAAVAALGSHRLLCAHRHGPYGVSYWNRQIEQWLSEETGDAHWAPMYVGRPLLVTSNDPAMDLNNGDTGVVVRRDGRLVAAFDAGTSIREVSAARLTDVETMHAATVHKSQGSQARRVTVLLPDADSQLLTRELLYTAVTRAQEEVAIIGTPETVRAALGRRIQRASGLRQRLATD
ncbi:exodeoxyribonuclease V subunit alpha [Nostocoides jenkinsii]|uniref:RecBCD enzyme subunit RecD n=1 Tax=Nostocoides jenkinsii Ben 74 TaxID=1193518 RepID=A0A077M9G7_9MICO|nr:exodeoxyribonuclease V subunit alpha [Tetrasphaera jenkinsii]CCI52490.1 Exodeoxyribonuclease V alpha chain [Tetrasphaera jenkinsii Ben 74]